MTRSRFVARTALACLCVAAAFSGRGKAGEPSTLGDRVLAFCQEHKGKRVGNGECTTLVVAALQSAGGRTHGPRHSDAADEPADGLNWGERVFVLERQGGPFKTTGRIQDVRPGDIVQFRDTLLSGPDGNFGNYTMRSHRHTAVVAQLDDSGTAIQDLPPELQRLQKSDGAVDSTHRPAARPLRYLSPNRAHRRPPPHEQPTETPMTRDDSR